MDIIIYKWLDPLGIIALKRKLSKLHISYTEKESEDTYIVYKWQKMWVSFFNNKIVPWLSTQRETIKQLWWED